MNHKNLRMRFVIVYFGSADVSCLAVVWSLAVISYTQIAT